MSQYEVATLGAGCFWCVEAIFQRLPGVISVVSGYTGGISANPNYEQICTGTTGHAEVVQITFDPHVLSFHTLLDVFWQTHDPTTLNRQGNDIGTQYRSAIFYHNEAQKAMAETSKSMAQRSFDLPLVTEITPLEVFYRAEDYHQNYFNDNPKQSYCVFVVAPKVEKFLQQQARQTGAEVF